MRSIIGPLAMYPNITYKKFTSSHLECCSLYMHTHEEVMKMLEICNII